MNNVKPMTRKDLGTQLDAASDRLSLDVFFITSLRATKDNTLQVEVCQNRILDGSKITALSVLNQSDKNFGKATTLVFDWIKTTPQDFVTAFPEVKLTIPQLEAVAKTWEENAPTGPDAIVHPVMATVKKMNVNGRLLTPKITVTEVTETAIKNGEFFTDSSARKDENIRRALEEDRRVMKTSSAPDAEYIVESSTGDRIFRYTRTEFEEFGAKDDLIVNKTSESKYKASLNKTRVATSSGFSPEELLAQSDIIGG
jgi:hypothetical protein